MRSLLLKNTETHKNPYRKITYLLTRWLSLISRATKQKRRTTNVSRRDISLSYMAVYRTKCTIYRRQGNKTNVGVGSFLLLLLLPNQHKKIMNKRKKVLTNIIKGCII